MSTPNERTDSVVQDPPVVAAAGPPPCRLPDELILMVVDWCDKLVKDRLKTLAALARLAKRFTVDVERHLYSRITLSDEPSHICTTPGLVRDVLARQPNLRRLVRAVELGSPIVHSSIGTRDDRIVDVLRDLPAVSEIICQWWSAHLARLVLSNPAVRIRRFESHEDVLDVIQLVRDYPAAFTAMQSLRSQSADLVHALSLYNVAKNVNALELTYLMDGDDLGTLTSPLGNILTRLTLPVSARLATCNVALYPSLQHLRVSSRGVDLDALRQATSGVVVFLTAAAQSASLVSFEWQCTAEPSMGSGASDMVVALIAAPSPIAKSFLAAVPRQICHLCLVTNCFASTDVAAYLVDDAQRPSQLATLRIGGALGRGLGRILGGEVGDEVQGAEGPCGALTGVLERAGIEVTTVE